ncbi:GNAT superfamily N-acetyltransferase [Achromobacter deleyi]|uniref:GNAT family N-acetyltransferase n=1 Tax=Achromobacter deleyi TaxID=1353891 RepID=UPI00285766AF|nr:GNAT family N-acetyltransferase [Achromobacter deleyi]MDR6600219.1 GNAT superfamily N-acetyltransferase [Achromobacter deleyi]
MIPLQDSLQILEGNLANFVRLASIGGHQLMYHPANIADFERDPNSDRRHRNLQRIRQYPALLEPAQCVWNTPDTGPNDACDNELLYALHCDAVHALVTEDRGIHAKARLHGLAHRVYTVQTAEDWLKRLHETRQIVLPNIQDVPLHSMTPELHGTFFDSLREGYPAVAGRDGFDDWLRRKARENGHAWIYRNDGGSLGAICIYQIQSDEVLNDAGDVLSGAALKLCTFKVSEVVRGRKIGELFLKAAFRFATENHCEHLFITANAQTQDYLVRMLMDFGFEERGTYRGDLVLVKSHPADQPPADGINPIEYVRRYFPHYRSDPSVQKFLVPIQPRYHGILFPDYASIQSSLFSPSGHVGNAIKLAYLCHAPTKSICAGDVLLFYRTNDEKAVTSLGVVERFEVSIDGAEIASLVSRRTVYSLAEIDQLAKKPTKVILFRLVAHLPTAVPYDQLMRDDVVTGPIQSIRKVSDVSFSRILAASKR